MKIPKKILLSPDLEKYCKKRNIWNQFLKAKNNLLEGYVFGGTQLRLRKSSYDQKWYFRINKKYRAIGRFDDDCFLVLAIDDHQ